LKEETLADGSTRTLMSLPFALAPVKAAILPLVNKDGLPEKADEIVNLLKYDFNVTTEAKDAIGKRYRRNDAIGTPYCITVDYDTMENNTVTLRNRDTMEQQRVAISELKGIMDQTASLSSLLKQLD
jgi:glycyl-tRNA synthetase